MCGAGFWKGYFVVKETMEGDYVTLTLIQLQANRRQQRLCITERSLLCLLFSLSFLILFVKIFFCHSLLLFTLYLYFTLFLVLLRLSLSFFEAFTL